MSLLPPRTKAKLDRLPKSERRMYAQELKGKYEYRLNHLEVAAHQSARTWMEEQGAHLQNVITELDAIIA